MGTHFGKRCSHKKALDKGKEDTSNNINTLTKRKDRRKAEDNNTIPHECHEEHTIIQESQMKKGNTLDENQDVSDCIKNSFNNESVFNNGSGIDFNHDSVLRVKSDLHDMSNEIHVNGTYTQENLLQVYPRKIGQMDLDSDNLCLETVQTCAKLSGSDVGLVIASVENEIDNSKIVYKDPEDIHLKVNEASKSISMNGEQAEQTAGGLDTTVETDNDLAENIHPVVDTNTEIANKFQGVNTTAAHVDAVANHGNDVIVNENINHDARSFDKMQARKLVSVSGCSSDKETTDPMLQNLEVSLVSMNCDNNDWANSVKALSKYVRVCIKTHEKEVTALLVKNRVADKFLLFLEIIKIELVAKLSNDDIDSLTCWTVFKRFLTLIWILCDGSVNFCQYILTSRVYEYLTMELRMLSTLSHNLCDRSLYLLKAILGIFHNICRHIPSSKWVFRNEGLVSVLRVFLNCDIPMVRVKTLMILSYITSETENEIINSDDENFQFIIEVLTDAVNSDNHMSLKYGMNAAEVLKGLCNLAINDENKIRMVKNGVLPLYEKFLEAGTKEEKRLTVTSLWSLAFHHYNKQKMRDMTGIMTKLRALEFPENYSDDDEICHAARGTIWELENICVASVDRNYSSSTEKDPNLPHIMISYQWDSQPIMVKVKDKLRQAGYKVWMDVEHMTGSTLEAMGLAVERAAVILICMSQKYKESPNCRTEAEYVYRLHKDFVPLRLQQDYVPDGWLGIMVGTRLYFDVYSEDIIDRQIPGLVKELGVRGKISHVYDSIEQGVLIPTRMISREAAPLLPSCSLEMASWSQADVHSWLTSAGCQGLVNRLPALDGPLLTELQHIQTKAPEFFYSILKSEFEFTVTEVLTFSKCLRNLTK